MPGRWDFGHKRPLRSICFPIGWPTSIPPSGTRAVWSAIDRQIEVAVKLRLLDAAPERPLLRRSDARKGMMADIIQVQAAGKRRKKAVPAASALRRIAAIWLPSIMFCICLLGLWEVMARTTASPLVPSVGEIVSEVRRLVVGGFAIRQIGITLGRILAGFGVAFVISLVIGIAAARSVTFRRFCDPAIILGLTVPGLVWALLCVIWFGVGLTTPIVAIALGITPVMILHVLQGMKAVDSRDRGNGACL